MQLPQNLPPGVTAVPKTMMFFLTVDVPAKTNTIEGPLDVPDGLVVKSIVPVPPSVMGDKGKALITLESRRIVLFDADGDQVAIAPDGQKVVKLRDMPADGQQPASAAAPATKPADEDPEVRRKAMEAIETERARLVAEQNARA